MMLDITPRIEKFISSQKMEDSKTQEHLLSLGRKLSKNFENDKGDEISVWMAHYIAEKITAIESEHGKEKSSMQRECFEAILLLWEHQSYFPNNLRPFDKFESIFRAMEHIDPNNRSPSFFRNENSNKRPPKDIDQYIEFITNLDAATRIMVSFFVREAILNAADESTLHWLDAIKGVVKSNEANIIFKFAPEINTNKDVNDSTSKIKNEKRINELSEYIDRLDAFEGISQSIKSVLNSELESLKNQ